MMRQVYTKIMACIAGIAALVQPAQAASARGQAVARVVGDRASVVGQTPLIFGYILSNSSAGTVTVSALNQRNVTGQINMLPGAYQRAIFIVRGQPNKSFFIQAPQSMIFSAQGVLPWLLAGRTTQLTAQNFTAYSANLKRSGNGGQLNAIGIDNIYLGGTLVVPKNAAAGLYLGQVPLTVSY